MPFSEHDLHAVGHALALAARTEIMPRFRKLTSTQIRQKSSALDLVTDADEAAEPVIGAALVAAFRGLLSSAKKECSGIQPCCKLSPRPNSHSSSIRSTALRTSSPICLCS